MLLRYTCRGDSCATHMWAATNREPPRATSPYSPSLYISLGESLNTVSTPVTPGLAVAGEVTRSGTAPSADQIESLRFAGLMVVGVLLGRPDHSALIPGQWVSGLFGNSSRP
jgi:hypothetical protein